MAAYKSVAYEGTISGAIQDAYAEFQSLRDEMEEWRSNMEEKLSHTEKFSAVEESAGALDGFCDDETDLDCLSDDAVLRSSQQVPTRKGRATGRGVRCSNAINLLADAVSSLEEKVEELDGTAEERRTATPPDEEAAKEAEDESAALEELRDHLENAISEAEGVEFPGMYG